MRMCVEILVHGEMNEMNRLKAAIVREYEDDTDFHIEVHAPRNTQSVPLQFRGEKTAKVVGQLALQPVEHGAVLSGVLVRRNFNYHLMHPSDLSTYTELSNCRVSQRQSLFYNGSLTQLLYNLQQIAGDLRVSVNVPPDEKRTLIDEKQLLSQPSHTISLFADAIAVHFHADHLLVVLEWISNPVNDMYADAALAAVLHAQANPLPETKLPRWDTTIDYTSSLCKSLVDVCGEESTVSLNEPGIVNVTVDGKTARIEMDTLSVHCDDQLLYHLLVSVCQKTMQTLSPISASHKG